jgi:hypothetical protein
VARRVNESQVVRWFCYAGFAVCSVLLIVVLSFDLDWRPSAVGSLLFGIPSLVMYRQEEQRRENLEVVRGVQQGARRQFDDSDDDDPTAPPVRKDAR